jgi:RimJ/RimL family protein N-acetyltransferase
VTQTAGIYLLAPEHADAIQRLAADPRIAATSSIPHPYPETGARDFIAQQLADRAAGRAWAFAIMDRGELVGVCAVHGLGPGEMPELGYWVGVPYWGRGYASFGLRMLLEFVFTNLRLERVGARVLEANPASARVLTKNGFQFVCLQPNTDPALHALGEPVGFYILTREQWLEQRDGPAIARLHPALRAILDAELAAGNEVMETGGGWPDADSVLVRLRHPFRTRPDPLPEGLSYTEPDDPHWWRADYSSSAPRHILAC